MLAEAKSSLGVVNTDFKIQFSYLPILCSSLVCLEIPLGYLICSFRTLRGNSCVITKIREKHVCG